MWSKLKVEKPLPRSTSPILSRQTELLFRLANRLLWKCTHLFCVFYQHFRELQKKKEKKNGSMNKPLFSSTEEDYFLVCYLGLLTFILYFANTKNYNLCGKGRSI